ncbi:MAG: hypothetical protein MUF42_15335, partial [Cytophagaceae bacterium]|nr:hypothetical protein [Cytophagaceae bacterium]
IEQMQRENLIKEEWEALKRDKETAELELKKERQEKEKALQEKELAQQEKEKERQEREKIQKVLITHLLSSGVSIKEIATQLNIPESEIQRWLE